MPGSVFDLFKIGIGPSSSHTVGPMKASRRFVLSLQDAPGWPGIERIGIGLFGSLALTGHGHGTDRAVILGLMGETPEEVAIDAIPARLEEIAKSGRLRLAGGKDIAFLPERDIVFHCGETLPCHPNGLRLSAFDGDGHLVSVEDYYSVGGGFILSGDAFETAPPAGPALPFAFQSAGQLLEMCQKHGLSIAGLAWANELALRSESEVDAGLHRLWAAMQDCVRRGLSRDGSLPGGLETKRRAPQLRRRLESDDRVRDPLEALEWVNAFAMAVGEENATGGRVVTAPTNGAAGIIPAVLHYLVRFVPGAGDKDVFTFLLVAAAIGSLYKENASISGAEVGCQGEVGVACSMAAAGLTGALGGSNEQI